jgi:hypothetical protein
VGTLKEKLSYLSETKEAIKQALIKQQVTVTDEDTFRSYADKIAGIEGGGGGSKVISTMPASNAGSINTDNMIEICSSDGANYSSEIEIQNIMANRVFANAEEAQDYAFANSIYSSDRQPWKAFDGNTSTLWSTESTDNQDGKYLGYNFHETVYNAEISLTVSTDNAGTPKFKLQGCESPTITDDSVWEDVSDEVTLNAYSDTHTLTYNVTNGKGYCAFRVLLLAGGRQGSTYGWAIYEMSIKGKGMEG